jgi:hypothetical protein
MGIGKRAAAAAVATIMGASLLLAGSSTATAAPAPSVSGKALLAWNTKCPSMAQSLKPVAPATSAAGRLVLPVITASGKEIKLGGSLDFYAGDSLQAVLTDFTIQIAGTNAGKFLVAAPTSTPSIPPLALFNIAKFKKVAVNAKTHQWSGVLQAPLRGTAQVPAQAVAQLLGVMCGAPVNPGDNLGSITVTVKSS